MKNMTCNETGGALIGAAKLAEMIGVEPRTIFNWADGGIIPVAVRVGRTVRFDLENVKQSLNEATERNQQARMRQQSPLTPADQMTDEGGPWNEMGPDDYLIFNHYTEQWESARKCAPTPVDPHDPSPPDCEDSEERTEWEREAAHEHASTPETDLPWN